MESKAAPRLVLPRPTLAGLAAMAAAAAFTVWVVAFADREPPAPELVTPSATGLPQSSTAPTATTPAPATPSFPPVAPVALTAAGLEARAATLGQPVYWAGPEGATRYELARSPDGVAILRYLPPDGVAGDERQLLTVGTFPTADAFAAVSTLTGQPGTVSRRLPGGGIAVALESRPTNAYVAFPGVPYRVEVYHPFAGTASRLAFAGRIRPVG